MSFFWVLLEVLDANDIFLLDFSFLKSTGFFVGWEEELS